MGKEDKIRTPMPTDQRLGDSPITNPVALTYFLRENVSAPQFFDVMRHPAAPTLFSMAKDSARRIATTLSGLQTAVELGTFDKSTFAVTRKRVLSHVTTDPVYKAATEYWTKNGEEFPLLSDGTIRVDEDPVRTNNQPFLFDGTYYSGGQGRILQLLAGATSDYPLTIRTLAYLTYPDEIPIDDAVDKTRTLLLNNLKKLLSKQHPKYELQSVGDPDTPKQHRIKKYWIAAKTASDQEANSPLINTGNVDTEKGKPRASITIHENKEYIIINDKIIPLYMYKGYPALDATDGLTILSYLDQHQGEYLSPRAVYDELEQNNPYGSTDSLKSRSSKARIWLDKNVTFEGSPLIQTQSKGSGTVYSIINVATEIQSTMTPLVEALRAATKDDPNKISMSELLELREGLDKRNIFVFPEGSTLSGVYASAIYLLLSSAPRSISVSDLLFVLYKNTDAKYVHDPRTFLGTVSVIVRKNLPEAKLIRFQEKGERRCVVKGYNDEINLGEAMTERSSEHIVYTAFSAKGLTDRNIVPQRMTDDPTLVNALDLASSLINRMRHDRNITWDDHTDEEKQALLRVIAYDLGKPVSMLRQKDFTQSKYEVLGNRGLGGLFSHIENSTLGDGQTDLLHIYFERLGIKATAEDAIISIKKEKRVLWQRMSWDEIHKIVAQAAKEKQLPIEYFSYSQSSQPFTFLDGQNLKRLWLFAHRHSEKSEDELDTEFLRRKLGLPEVAKGARAKYRWIEMQKFADELAIDPSQRISPDALMQWAENVAGLYKNFFPTIEAAELLSVSQDAVLEILSTGIPNMGHFISGVQRRLETYVSHSVIKEVSKGTRKEYRNNELLKLAQTLSIVPGQEITSDLLLQWTERVAGFYSISFPSIEIDELQNEAYLATVNTLRNDTVTNQDEFIATIASDLENAIRDPESRMAHLDTPVESSSSGEQPKSHKDILKFDVNTQDFSIEWRERLRQLTPLQRFLALATPDEEMTFENIADEIHKRFGITLDVDILQEQYQEALDILRDTL